jgi:hypothetical protein
LLSDFDFFSLARFSEPCIFFFPSEESRISSSISILAASHSTRRQTSFLVKSARASVYSSATICFPLAHFCNSLLVAAKCSGANPAGRHQRLAAAFAENAFPLMCPRARELSADESRAIIEASRSITRPNNFAPGGERKRINHPCAFICAKFSSTREKCPQFIPFSPQSCAILPARIMVQPRGKCDFGRISSA